MDAKDCIPQGTGTRSDLDETTTSSANRLGVPPSVGYVPLAADSGGIDIQSPPPRVDTQMPITASVLSQGCTGREGFRTGVYEMGTPLAFSPILARSSPHPPQPIIHAEVCRSTSHPHRLPEGLMLPLALFEHLTRTSSLRSCRPGHEKRDNIRVPLRGIARIIPVEEGRLGAEVPTRLKDLSRSGLAFLAPRRLCITDAFVAGVPTPSGGVIWLWCQTRRQRNAGESDRLICGSITRILVPGQTPITGSTTATLKWLEVESNADFRKTA